jgi:cytochrome c oxidase cbb3-type subunit 2
MSDTAQTHAPKRSIWSRHKIFETNSIIMILGVLVVISIGGLVEIAPLFYLKSTIEKVDGMRPYTPLELAGRAIYVREGCYNCHSQMIRPLRDEVERYGPYSLAAESMYDKPFQWGSKRTGPDLARVGGKYSDEWHLQHLNTPRQIVPQSIMPGYPFLAKTDLEFGDISTQLKVQSFTGIPYTAAMMEAAMDDVRAQVDPDHPKAADFAKRYPKANVRDFDGNPQRISEADALIAYLQVLGTLVDFKTYDNKANLR